MEEQPVRSSSPPLPGKGYYNMDFDALEDSFSPYQAPEEVKQSPPLIRKDADCNLIGESEKEAPESKREESKKETPEHKKVAPAESKKGRPENKNFKETPENKKETPESKKETPESKKESPESNKETPEFKKGTPESKKETPENKKETPENKKETPESKKETPESKKGTPEKKKGTPESKKETKKETPESKKETPESKKETPENKKETPESKKGTPESKKETPESKKGTPENKKGTPESKKETPPSHTEVAQDDNKSLSEIEATPKRKKSKPSSSSSSSSKKSLVVIPGHDSEVSQKADGSVMSVDEGAEKPVKQRKSGRKSRSARPMSKSCDEQLFQAEQGGEMDIPDSPMLKSYHEQSTPKKKHRSKDSSTQRKEVTPHETSSNISVDPQNSAPVKEHPGPEKSPVPSEKAVPSKNDAPSPKKTPEGLVSDSALETSVVQSENSTPQMERSLTALDKAATLPRKHRARSASTASEDGSDVRPKKDRSGGKVKKSKKSSSSSRSERTDGNQEGADTSEKGKEKKSSRRRTSQCEGEGKEPREPGANEESSKSSSPPESMQEGDKSPVDKGECCMTTSHSRDSVVKLVQVLKYSQSDWNKLRQELDGHFQTQLRANDGDWSAKLAERESHAAALEEQIRKLKLTNEDMRAVMGEFEKTIGQLQAEKEKTKNATQQSLKDVLKEKDQALEDLRSVETAFSDLHRRYEKTKAVLEGFRQNEDVLKKCAQDLQNKVKKAEHKTQTIRLQAEDQLDRATEELERAKKVNALEITRLEAALRKAQIQVESVEAALEQKGKENRELTAICDELIGKVQ
ncbi:hypothetical protein ACOMHN_036071 [Nucella lapillus]